jgi:NAD(P)-dependent dehydrogenase (short-subunit alcohol dehydrogenase family)
MKTALITGIISGLGLDMVYEFAKARYNIVFIGLEKVGRNRQFGLVRV